MHPLARRTTLALTLSLASASAQVLGNDPKHPLAPPPGIKQPAPTALTAGKQALSSSNFVEAKRIFSAELKQHPHNVDARLGLADAELALDEYEPAEADYRQVVDAKPELWQAHKNLVVVEAALGRWEDFDGERTVLRLARQRGAPGISTRDSDLIDSFTIRGQRWLVREYFEPAGRSQTRYNFEHFSPAGKVLAYISLDAAPLATSALPNSVTIGEAAKPTPVASNFVLTWLNGKAHGTIKTYGSQEPTYEHLRAEVQHWLRTSSN